MSKFRLLKRFSLVLFLVSSFAIAGTEFRFTTKAEKTVTVSLVNSDSEIDQTQAKDILIDSFILEYRQYLQPEEIDSSLRYWFAEHGEPSVETYYSNYFNSEFKEFQKGHLIWVQAKMDDKLVGWVTFQPEPNQQNAVYMNLLAVRPGDQKQGIGRELVHSLQKFGLHQDTKFINLLLRKKNQGGRDFYSRLKFKSNPDYKRDNYVDTSLLEGWTLEL